MGSVQVFLRSQTSDVSIPMGVGMSRLPAESPSYRRVLPCQLNMVQLALVSHGTGLSRTRLSLVPLGNELLGSFISIQLARFLQELDCCRPGPEPAGCPSIGKGATAGQSHCPVGPPLSRAGYHGHSSSRSSWGLFLREPVYHGPKSQPTWVSRRTDRSYRGPAPMSSRAVPYGGSGYHGQSSSPGPSGNWIVADMPAGLPLGTVCAGDPTGLSPLGRKLLRVLVRPVQLAPAPPRPGLLWTQWLLASQWERRTNRLYQTCPLHTCGSCVTTTTSSGRCYWLQHQQRRCGAFTADGFHRFAISEHYRDWFMPPYRTRLCLFKPLCLKIWHTDDSIPWGIETTSQSPPQTRGSGSGQVDLVVDCWVVKL